MTTSLKSAGGGVASGNATQTGKRGARIPRADRRASPVASPSAAMFASHASQQASLPNVASAISIARHVSDARVMLDAMASLFGLLESKATTDAYAPLMALQACHGRVDVALTCAEDIIDAWDPLESSEPTSLTVADTGCVRDSERERLISRAATEIAEIAVLVGDRARADAASADEPGLTHAMLRLFTRRLYVLACATLSCLDDSESATEIESSTFAANVFDDGGH